MANVTADDIREVFSRAMSTLYQQEVPQYSTLLELVADVNMRVLEKSPDLHQKLANTGELTRLNVECHGAIRVGNAQELSTLRRIFQVMGMYPVGYYDLSQAGVPIHATAFRPVDETSLARNPFRLFTSLLRPELIADAALRHVAQGILATRDIFTPRCRELLALHEQHGTFSESQAQAFVDEVLKTFRWHRHATVDVATYQALCKAHPLVADVLCFRGCHINHLTPRTLDIDYIQAMMPEYGIVPRAIIEGPPRRKYPLLLRQTRFQAREEPVLFTDDCSGTHTARFGEVEQRGMALTPEGRAQYDKLLRKSGSGKDNLSHQRQLHSVFSAFPDDEREIRRQKLGYFRYRLTPAGESHRHAISAGDCPQTYIDCGWLEAHPITYEDFLPISAVGILQSNLGDNVKIINPGRASRDAFITALGCPILDEFALYQEAENRSKRRCGLL